jgi:hypothetical protein
LYSPNHRFSRIAPNQAAVAITAAAESTWESACLQKCFTLPEPR